MPVNNEEKKILSFVPVPETDRIKEAVEKACSELKEWEVDQFITIYRNQDRGVGFMVDSGDRITENMGFLSMAKHLLFEDYMQRVTEQEGC